MSKPNYYGLIMAGGRGTRFWPRSRRSHAKQVLPFFGERTLIQQTVDRLKPVLPPERLWIITNGHLRDEIIALLAFLAPVPPPSGADGVAAGPGRPRSFLSALTDALVGDGGETRNGDANGTRGEQSRG